MHRVHYSVLAGPRGDARYAELGLDRRAPRDDVPRHEVRIRRVRLDRDDLDFLRDRRLPVQHVREFGAQHADLPVRALRPVQLEPLGSDERPLLLASDLSPPFLPERTVSAARGLPSRPTLPQGHGGRTKGAGVYDRSGSDDVDGPIYEKARKEEPEQRTAVQEGEAGLRIPLQHVAHQDDEPDEAADDGHEGDDRVRRQGAERETHRVQLVLVQKRERGDREDAGDDEVAEADEHRLSFLPAVELRLEALLVS